MVHDYDPAHRMVRDYCKFARRKVVPNTMTAAVASLEWNCKNCMTVLSGCSRLIHKGGCVQNGDIATIRKRHDLG
jgi:hypothetical protein